MKKIHYLVFVMALLVSYTTFAQNRAAVKYNNKIVNRQHKITKGFMKLFASFEKGTKEQMDKRKTQLVETIDQAIADTKAMDGFEGDTELRDGAVKLFGFYKRTLKEEYPHMIELIAKRDRSEEDHKKLEEFEQKLISEEEEIDHMFEQIQIEYARRHGLKLVIHKN